MGTETGFQQTEKRREAPLGVDVFTTLIAQQIGNSHLRSEQQTHQDVVPAIGKSIGR